MRSARETVLVLAVALLLAVALVNLVANLQDLRPGEPIPFPQPGVSPFLGIDPSILLIVFILGGVGLLFLAYLWTRPRAGPVRFRELLPVAFAAVVLLALVYLVGQMPFSPAEGGGAVGGGGGEGDASGLGEDSTIEGEDITNEEPREADDSTVVEGDTPAEGDEGDPPTEGDDTTVVGGDPPAEGDDTIVIDEGEAGGANLGDEGRAGEAVPLIEQLRRLVLRLLPLIFAFAAIVTIYMLWSRFQPRRELSTADPNDLREAIKQELIRAWEDHTGKEVRAAILASYRDMLNLFRAYGLTPGAHLTAREVEFLAFDILGLNGGASRELRRLFEVARYSVHDLDGEARTEAIQSFRHVRLELGV